MYRGEYRKSFSSAGGLSANLHRPQIASVLNHFHAGNRPRPQMTKYGIPIVRWPVTQSQRNAGVGASRRSARIFSSQRAGGPVEKIAEYFVEAPHTAKPRGQSHFGHRHLRFMNQMFGKKYPPRLRYGNRRSSQMLQK